MLTYYGLKVGLLLAAILPGRLAYWLCSVVGNLAVFLNGSSRRAVQDNMRHVLGPDAGRRQLNKLARYVFRNTVKNYYELLCLPRLKPDDLERRIKVLGIEHVEAALAGGNGVILFSGHIGNFNLVAQISAIRGFPTNIIAEQMHPPRLHDLVNGLRERFGLKLIPLGPTAVRGIYHALRANEVLGLAADRDLTASGTPVEFFGEVTELPSGLAALSLRLKAPLVPVHVVRKANDASVVTVSPPITLASTGDREHDTLVGTQLITRIMEEMIRKTPEQWVVLQPVWPDPPAGQPAPAATTPPVADPPMQAKSA
ncbi:MAG TPA: lipid A biosynthesis acyltransferase [Chloroflexia bacterium]|nr:lipid A biosynthesis acyltransferase [Chloroflexia bacterium]